MHIYAEVTIIWLPTASNSPPSYSLSFPTPTPTLPSDLFLTQDTALCVIAQGSASCHMGMEGGSREVETESPSTQQEEGPALKNVYSSGRVMLESSVKTSKTKMAYTGSSKL